MIPHEAVKVMAYFLWQRRLFWGIRYHPNGREYTPEDDYYQALHELELPKPLNYEDN